MDNGGEQLHASFNFAQRYRSMQPEAILSETPGNYAIQNSTIQEIKVKLHQINNGLNRQHELEIEIRRSIVDKFKMD